MLKLEKLNDAEKDLFVALEGIKNPEYATLIAEFAQSGEEVSKVTGYSVTDALKVYSSLYACAKNKGIKEFGVKVAKRGETVYLMNTKVNPVVDPPEKR